MFQSRTWQRVGYTVIPPLEQTVSPVVGFATPGFRGSMGKCGNWGRKATRARDRPSHARMQNQKALGHVGWRCYPALLPRGTASGTRVFKTALQSWFRHTRCFALKCKGKLVLHSGVINYLCIKRACTHIYVAWAYICV